MPGEKCAVLGCGSCRRTKGIGIWKLPYTRDEAHKKWREDWLSEITKTRESNHSFKVLLAYLPVKSTSIPKTLKYARSLNFTSVVELKIPFDIMSEFLFNSEDIYFISTVFYFFDHCILAGVRR